jgi:hypothetical protein
MREIHASSRCRGSMLRFPIVSRFHSHPTHFRMAMARDRSFGTFPALFQLLASLPPVFHSAKSPIQFSARIFPGFSRQTISSVDFIGLWEAHHFSDRFNLSIDLTSRVLPTPPKSPRSEHRIYDSWKTLLTIRKFGSGANQN